MMYTVGPRGQILLARDVREKLNIEPGTRIVQMVVGDHVELHFVRPTEKKKKAPTSTAGFLLQHKELKPPEPTAADLERAERKRRAALLIQGSAVAAGAS